MPRPNYRRPLVVLATVAGCAGLAFAVSASRTSVYRATAKLVVTRDPSAAATAPATAATLRDLVRSNVVATNVVESLRLPLTPDRLLGRISAKADARASVVDVSVDDSDRARAVQIDQQVAVVFQRLVGPRLGAGVSAQVFDPAHALPDRVSPRPVRAAAFGALGGVLLGLAALALMERGGRKRPAPRSESPRDADAERRHAAQVAALEKLLRSRDRSVEDLRRAVARLEAASAAHQPAAHQPAAHQVEPLEAMQPAPPLAPLTLVPPEEAEETAPVASVAAGEDEQRRSPVLELEPAPGSFSLDALQDAAALHQDAPEAANWVVYATFLREHADLYGVLPPEFEGLVHEVYGDLIERVRAGR